MFSYGIFSLSICYGSPCKEALKKQFKQTLKKAFFLTRCCQKNYTGTEMRRNHMRVLVYVLRIKKELSILHDTIIHLSLIRVLRKLLSKY